MNLFRSKQTLCFLEASLSYKYSLNILEVRSVGKMVQLGITLKSGKGAGPANGGEDPEHDFEDENNITIKVLETENGPATSS